MKKSVKKTEKKINTYLNQMKVVEETKYDFVACRSGYFSKGYVHVFFFFFGVGWGGGGGSVGVIHNVMHEYLVFLG